MVRPSGQEVWQDESCCSHPHEHSSEVNLEQHGGSQQNLREQHGGSQTWWEPTELTAVMLLTTYVSRHYVTTKTALCVSHFLQCFAEVFIGNYARVQVF